MELGQKISFSLWYKYYFLRFLYVIIWTFSTEYRSKISRKQTVYFLIES